MPRFAPPEASCRIFTFKEGLLSPIAHDLEIDVERFELVWDEAGSCIEARFDAASLRVLHAVKAGVPDRSALSERDRRTIEGHIRDDVLEAKTHPEIRFRSSEIVLDEDGARVRGDLALHGHIRGVEARARKQNGRWIAETRLHQPDFGIAPYTAMMGTLRVRPEVRVRIEAPA